MLIKFDGINPKGPIWINPSKVVTVRNQGEERTTIVFENQTMILVDGRAPWVSGEISERL